MAKNADFTVYINPAARRLNIGVCRQVMLGMEDIFRGPGVLPLKE
jgi:hypothetical protein